MSETEVDTDENYEHEVECDEKQAEAVHLDRQHEFGEGEVVVVNLGFSVGDRFASFQEFLAKFLEACKAHYVRFSKRDSRSIEAAKRKVNRSLKPELEYYHLKYNCFFSHNNNSRGTGKRKRQSLSQQIPVACPASMALRATDDGKFLEIFHLENFHNHSVSKEEYKKLVPNKRAPVTTDLNNLIKDDSTEYDKYKAVLTKGKEIAKLASVSDPAQVRGIIKNLDDFLYYLKYTAMKREDDEKKKRSLLK